MDSDDSERKDTADIDIRSVKVSHDRRSATLKLNGLQAKRIFERNLGEGILARDGSKLINRNSTIPQ